jgi:hypothetical protein
VFVEAHTVGQDDWTTCPTRTGTRARTPESAVPTTDPFWLQENPFLTHYITRSGTPRLSCTPTGTTGAWNARPGNSAASRTGTST